MEETYVDVVGENAELKAKKIAEFYGTRAEGNHIISNKEVEKNICYSDESIENACDELTAALGMHITPNDFEF